ncbi:MAG: 3-deoxy-manno-octulosonate cytidylyltransferase [Gammaproteobacteria bacterium]|nr:3-deoxy-manno-octulosonate cytidylyltransferase [Gammaproteobacteria bacterium]
MSTPFTVLIPARYASRRLPGKPLADLKGKPMIVRVAEVARAAGARRVVVATDDGRIADAVESFNFEACITSTHHASGTDRIAQAAAMLQLEAGEVVVNLQGDEPLMPPPVVAQVAARLAEAGSAMASACEMLRAGDVDNLHVVKVVMSEVKSAGCALDFTRRATPAMRRYIKTGAAEEGDGFRTYHRHLGLYAYRAAYLAVFTSLEPPPEEQAQKLEQLRALHNGDTIAMAAASTPCGGGVDTPEQLEQARRMFTAAEAK